MLDAPTGPLLRDYPHDAPATTDDEVWACPVSIPEPEPASAAEAVRQRLQHEIDLLRPWYDEGRRARGRTAVGVSGKGVDAIDQMATMITTFATGADPSGQDGFGHPLPLLLRYLADDLKAFYFEAVAAQPGRATASSGELNRWLFHETTLGDLLYRVRDRLAAVEDRRVNWMQGVIVPAAFRERETA